MSNNGGGASHAYTHVDIDVDDDGENKNMPEVVASSGYRGHSPPVPYFKTFDVAENRFNLKCFIHSI